MTDDGRVKFSTTMSQMGNNTGIEVPAEVVAELGGGKRASVVVTVNGYEYRSTIASMGGKFLLPFSAERRKESGIAGGDAIAVELALDVAPRVVEVPDDLQVALDGSPTAAAAWHELSYSQRKAHVTAVCGAKAADTRARRIAGIVAKLAG
ncbi:YdeI/OmpD-associated family protein [Mycolicibacterium sp.]|uniref:YdeI/OmpD-associated family protein n=1 Tax=Mycolicibacterium sp. TaxID=2320850 RepID=UPI0025F81AE8|nr:YdeI/OmpD-associated family protein [Mycolicibacterium sp.]